MGRLILASSIAILISTSAFLSASRIQDSIRYSSFRYVTSIAADLETIYFGTTDGIVRFSKIYNRWLDPLTEGAGLPSNYIIRLAYDPQFNELWAQTRNGPAKYNLTFAEWYAESEFPDSLERNDWKSTLFPSLFTPFRLSYQAGVLQDQFFRTFRITSGIRDGQNDLMYIGTWGLGPGVINTRYRNLILLPYGPYNSAISKVIEVGRYLWMGTPSVVSGGALTRFDRRTGEWKYYEQTAVAELRNSELLAAVETGDYTWIATRDGLIRKDSDDRMRLYTTFQGLPSDEVLALCLYNGRIFIGTTDGLGILPANGELSDSGSAVAIPAEYRLPGQRINDLSVFGGKLLIATNQAVYRLADAPWKIEQLDTPAGDLAAGATDIFSGGGKLYFAVDFGVVVVDSQTEASFVASDFALPHRRDIRQVYAADSMIWCATASGLWRYDIRDKTSTLLTDTDGLPSRSLNSIIADGEYFWVGCDRGLLKLRRNELDDSD